MMIRDQAFQIIRRVFEHLGAMERLKDVSFNQQYT